MKKAVKGNFYAVGIGPGCADLLTVRAVNIIGSADVVIAPRSELATKSLALESVKEYINFDTQEVIEHIYPMNRDNDGTIDSWTEVAVIVEDRIKKGLSVVQITLGDPNIYSTSTYLINCLEGRINKSSVKIIPGISAFQAAAAKFVDPLCLQEDRVLIMPATDLSEVEKALGTCETMLLYKAGKNIEKVRALLREKNLLGKAKTAFYVEQEGEILWADMESDIEHEGKYMTVVIVHCGSRDWK